MKGRSFCSSLLAGVGAGVLVATALVSCDSAWCSFCTEDAGEQPGSGGFSSGDGTDSAIGDASSTDSRGGAIDSGGEAGAGVTTFSTSRTWNVPVGVSQLIVEAWGGGGGGGSGEVSSGGSCISGGGGGEGAYARALMAVTPGDTLVITVGGAGAAATQNCVYGAAAPTPATAGGNTTVALSGTPILTSGGGQPGEGPAGGEPGSGGAGASATFSTLAVGLTAVTGNAGSGGLSDISGGPGGGGADTTGAGGRGGASTAGLPTAGMAGLVLVTPVSE
jgi:hypothetical protein